MSKELVISTSPHETRVAKIEDGQLCEIYIEREKELALVGSIYKGRVTRVLPGMQSAFVDIGLDGDAFLYVSDFLEQVEEFDSIETTVEGKTTRMEQEGGQVFTPPDASSSAVEPPEVLGPAPELSPDEPQPASNESAPLHQPPPPSRPPFRNDSFNRRPSSSGPRGFDRRGGRSSGGGGGRDRGGPRGGRFGRSGSSSGGSRDRGGRSSSSGGERRFGRDLPPAKYASPHMPYEPSEPGEVLEPIILPGESLAKYRDRKPAPPASSAPAETAAPETINEAPAPVEAGNRYAPPSEEPSDERDSQTDFFPPYYPPKPEAPAAPARPVWAAPQAVEPVTESPVISPVPDFTAEEPSAASTHSDEEHGEGDTHELSQAELQTIADHIVEEKIEDHAASEEEGDETHEDAEADAMHEAATAEEDTLPLGFTLPSEERNELSDSSPFSESASSHSDSPAEEPTENEPYIQQVPVSDETPGYSARLQGETRARFQRPVRRGGSDRPRPGRPPQRRFRGRPDRGPQASRKPQLISELLKAGQEIIVQIAKEPLGKKGARITSHVALPGRFLVYMPTVDHIGVSRKIASADQRSRLRRLVLETKGAQNFPGGFIVRTAAQSATDEDIRTDVEYLGRSWKEIKDRAEQRKSPALLHRDLNLVERILRDYLSPDYAAIWIDNEEEFSKIVEFVGRFQPQMVSRVKLYGKQTPIFEEFGIQQEIDKALRPKVWLKSGGYIVINHTEALVAIDVNTGKFVGKGSTRLEDTIVKTNVEAVKEIVRQIRLRDLGGIIVLDFIDMEERRNREKVLAALHDALRSDRAPSKVLSFNEFGLVAITRKRTKQALERVLCQPCPYCTGSGMVKSMPTLCYEIQAEARKMAAELDNPSLTLRVHPEIAKTLKTRESALIDQLEQWTKKSVIIQADPTLHWEQYDIF